MRNRSDIYEKWFVDEQGVAWVTLFFQLKNGMTGSITMSKEEYEKCPPYNYPPRPHD